LSLQRQTTGVRSQPDAAAEGAAVVLAVAAVALAGQVAAADSAQRALGRALMVGVSTAIVAASTGGAVLYAITLWAVLVIAPATITALKGKWELFDLGFLLVGTVWFIAAFRLARPDSFWARKFYGARKLERARRRYGPDQV
jgi:hypothetical protein